VLTSQALTAAWIMGDGGQLRLFANFGSQPVIARLPGGEPLADSRLEKTALADVLPPQSCLAWISSA
jgi:hypothetical protein